MKKAIVGQAIQFTFDGLDGITFNADKASDATRAHAMLHGFMQRLGDAAAISRTQKDGSVITVTEEMRRNAVLEMVAHYESGTDQWNLVASKTPKQNPTIAAIAAKRGCTYAEAEAFLADQFLNEMQ